MTPAARSNLQPRQAPYGDNGFVQDYTAQVRGAPIGWPCWSPATPPGTPYAEYFRTSES